jgi:hypothetical protein
MEIGHCEEEGERNSKMQPKKGENGVNAFVEILVRLV